MSHPTTISKCSKALKDLDRRIAKTEQLSLNAIKNFKHHCDAIHTSYSMAVQNHKQVVCAVSKRRIMTKTYSMYPTVRFGLDFIASLPPAICLSMPVLMTMHVFPTEKISAYSAIGVIVLSQITAMITASVRDIVKKGREAQSQEDMKIDPLRGINHPALVEDKYNRLKIRFENCIRLKLNMLRKQRKALATSLSNATYLHQEQIVKINKNKQIFFDLEAKLISLCALPSIASSSEIMIRFERRIWAEWIHNNTASFCDKLFKIDSRGNWHFPIEVVRRLEELSVFDLSSSRELMDNEFDFASNALCKYSGPKINNKNNKSLKSSNLRLRFFSPKDKLEPQAFGKIKDWVEQERVQNHPFFDLKIHLKQTSFSDYLVFFKEDMVSHLFTNDNIKELNETEDFLFWEEPCSSE